MYDKDDARMQFDPDKDVAQPSGEAVDESMLSDEQHTQLVDYLKSKLDKERPKRGNRIQRFARIDQMVSTWQRLSEEDSMRDSREDMTGKSQAIPVNLPVAQAHIDDAVAFFSEVFAPLGGNFYADPGQRSKTEAVKKLTAKMNQDTKINNYYFNITCAMRALHKYNLGGFHITWTPGNKLDESEGNKCESIDVYNFMYDPSVVDMQKLHKDGEWAAIAGVRNRLWLIRQAEQNGLINLDKIFSERPGDGSNSYEFGKASYYRYPPSQTNIESDGGDTKSGNGVSNVDWAKYGLGTDADSVVDIDGHEVILMYCWINEKQFDLYDEDNEESPIQLYRFTLVDGRWIVAMDKMEEATELPIYMARLNVDELKEAARSIAEHIKPFQRFMSFLINTHIEGIRSQIWGLKGVDPTMFDVSKIQNGETSGLLVSKIGGRDVRSGLVKLDNNLDSRQNMADAGSVLDLMKQFFPNQSLPAQIAGMDRAITSQVSAVMQGSMRKLHMFVRMLDSSLMLPTRMAQYRNIAKYDKEKSQFTAVTDEEVADLLNSGLGQITREAAAEQIRSLIFALIQNPDAAKGIDMMGLWTLYSLLLNIGTDLGQFMIQPTLSNEQTAVDPTTGAATGASTESMPAGMAGIIQ